MDEGRSVLACPVDRAPLAVSGSSARCPSCGREYKNEAGIWRILPPADEASPQSSVVEWFDSRAENIEDDHILRGEPDKWHDRFFARDVAEIRRMLRIDQAERLLDVGCGNGLFLEQYAGLVKEAVGSDVSFKMLKRAKDRLKSPNVLLVQADSLRLPFVAGAFDAVLCNWVLHYFKHREVPRFLAELRRVSKKGARIFVGEIPLRRSLRSYEARVGHFMVDRFRIKVSDRYLSPVDTSKFTPGEIRTAAEQSGLSVLAEGTMRHVLPSLRIPHVGQLVPNRVQHLLAPYDYKRVIPLASHSYFFTLQA